MHAGGGKPIPGICRLECRPHLWVYAGAKESLMDRREKFGPQERPGAKASKRNPGGLLEGEDSSGANQASQRAQKTEAGSGRNIRMNRPTDASKSLSLSIWCTSAWVKFTLRNPASATRALARESNSHRVRCPLPHPMDPQFGQEH